MYLSSPNNDTPMIRKILIPQERTYVLELPESFLGKEVEVLAFEVEKRKEIVPSKSLEDLEKELIGLTVNDPDFVFDRDEANDYE